MGDASVPQSWSAASGAEAVGGTSDRRGPGAVDGAPTETRDVLARRVWNEQYRPLCGWTAALVGDVDVAHDIVAEAFTRLLGRWHSVRDPKPFLYAVAGNLARDHWRTEERARRLVERAGSVARESDPAVDPWLRDLVERLPDRLRMPVLLHYYADLPVSAVAAALHRPEGTIKRSLAEGRAALLTSIGEDTR